MYKLWNLLIICSLFLGIPTTSKAVVDSYSLDEREPSTFVCPLKSVAAFRADLELLPPSDRDNVHYLRLGSAVIDTDIPEISVILRSTLPHVATLDLSETNISGDALERSLPDLLSLSILHTLYLSRHFTSADKRILEATLSQQGKGWFERRRFLKKIKRKPSEQPRGYKEERNTYGTDSHGRGIVLE